MPFRFAYICTLLEKLHHIFARHPPYLPRDVQQMSTRVITLWFKQHELKIKHDVDGLLLLSILPPETYVDRTYGLSERDLGKVVGRAFSLSTAQFEKVLNRANSGDLSDLGHRVEQVTRQCVGRGCSFSSCCANKCQEFSPYSRAYNVSIEEIEEVLSLVASQHTRATQSRQSFLLKPAPSALDKLGPLYKCLLPSERKWLTRFIMKSYAPIVIPEDLIFSLYHPLLSGLIRVNFDLRAAPRFIRRLEEEPAPLNAPVSKVYAVKEGNEGNEGNGSAFAARVSLSALQGSGLMATDENAPVQRKQPAAQRMGDVVSGAQSADVMEVSMYGSLHGTTPCNIGGSAVKLSKRSSQPLGDIASISGNRFPVKALSKKSITAARVRSPGSQSNRGASSHVPGTVASGSPSRSTKLSSQHHVCPKEGRHCLFYKKDIGLIPSLCKSAKLASLLVEHRVISMSFGTLLRRSQKVIVSKIRRRRILLIDRSLDGVETAVEKLRAMPSCDFKGLKQWVDVYDWRLLEYVEKHGSCRDSKLEYIRRYWIGTV